MKKISFDTEVFYIKRINVFQCGYKKRPVEINQEGVCEAAEDPYCHIRTCEFNRFETEKPAPFQLSSLSFRKARVSVMTL